MGERPGADGPLRKYARDRRKLEKGWGSTMADRHQERESLLRSIRIAFCNVVGRPTMMICSAVTMFVALEGNLGGLLGPSADELRIPDSILFAKRDPNLFDPEAAAQLDEFLTSRGWVEDIVH